MTSPSSNANNANSDRSLQGGLGPLSAYPTAKEVNDFHRNSDLDRRPESQHHSLGRSHNQAAYGDHGHNGNDSALLIPQDLSTTFSQNLGTFQGMKDAIKQLVQVMVALGATDSTTVSGQYPEIRSGSLTCNFAVTGQLSAAVPFTFSTPMSGVPALVMTCRSTSSTIQYVAMQNAGLSSSGCTARVWASASTAAGANVPVDYVAVYMRTFT